jgi:hypothetical protein
MLKVKDLLEKLKAVDPESEVLLVDPNFCGYLDRVLTGKGTVILSSEPPK